MMSDTVLSGIVPKIIFSDIDGTIVHYEKNMPQQGYTKIATHPADEDKLGREAATFSHTSGATIKCWKVPSLTLGGGYISEHTLTLVDKLQEHGVYFVLMTGARTSTMIMRRHSATLPKTEFDVCEGGGNMWRRASCDDQLSVPNVADWSSRFEAICGPPQDCEPHLRKGGLWDIYRVLSEDGFALDAKSFSTSFLVLIGESPRVTSGEMSVAQAETYLKQKFQDPTDLANKGFWFVTNLNKGQVVCKGSGKHEAANYIINTLNIPNALESAIALFDDENDLEFAQMCGAGFIPSIAHASVKPALQELNAKRGMARFVQTELEGPLGTDAALIAILSALKMP